MNGTDGFASMLLLGGLALLGCLWIWGDRQFRAQQQAPRRFSRAELDRLRDREAEWRAAVEACVARHRDALLRSLRRALTHDAYGNLLFDRFNKEVEYFYYNVLLYDALAQTDAERAYATQYISNWALDIFAIESETGPEAATQPDGVDYERFVGGLLARAGFAVRYTPASGDQGVDVIAERGALRAAIQCKFYSSNVGNDAVQQVYAGGRFHGANRTIVVAPVSFTRSAVELARTLGVTCLHHDELIDHLSIMTATPSAPRHEGQSENEIAKATNGD